MESHTDFLGGGITVPEIAIPHGGNRRSKLTIADNGLEATARRDARDQNFHPGFDQSAGNNA